MIPALKNHRVEAVFQIYNTWLIRRFFSRVYIRCSDDINVSIPTLYVCNHANWWDVFLALWINKHYLRQDAFFMLHENELERQRFLNRCGAFSINPNTYQDVREAMEYGAELLEERFSSLWLFGQGEVAHQDARPIRLLPGLGALFEKVKHMQVVPVSFFYSFTEQRPTAYVYLSEPLIPTHFEKGNRRTWVAACEKELTLRLDELRQRVVRGETDEFTCAIEGFPPSDELWQAIAEQVEKVGDLVQKLRKGRDFL